MIELIVLDIDGILTDGKKYYNRNGDVVMKDHEIGRSGQTGLAGGDHLHFSTLLAGRPVSPVEWWDDHWIEDRVFRKIRALEVTLP